MLAPLVLPVSATSKRFFVGVSQQRSFMQIAHTMKEIAGTIMATRQAVLLDMPAATNGLKSTAIMKICVTPPPKLPQPAAVAFAVPTTFGANMSEDQNWFVTKVAPAVPMKNRRTEYIIFPLIRDERP